MVPIISPQQSTNLITASLLLQQVLVQWLAAADSLVFIAGPIERYQRLLNPLLQLC